MSAILQNLFAITLVAACGSWAVWQGVKSMSGKRSKLGSCCAKGCGAGEQKKGVGDGQPAVQKVHFLPADMLRRR